MCHVLAWCTYLRQQHSAGRSFFVNPFKCISHIISVFKFIETSLCYHSISAAESPGYTTSLPVSALAAPPTRNMCSLALLSPSKHSHCTRLCGQYSPSEQWKRHTQSRRVAWCFSVHRGRNRDDKLVRGGVNVRRRNNGLSSLLALPIPWPVSGSYPIRVFPSLADACL